MFFSGTLIGFILIGTMVDNLGRRISLLICIVIALIGTLAILLSPNLILVDIGLFMAGLGMENAFTISFYFFTEVL